MSGDTELLRRYVEERSEAAFTELVRLHLNLVYFAALRQVGGDTHCAQDVAQAVFTDLARKAASLTGRATLTGWLHTSTRFAAAKVRRADFSRQHHEQQATTMNALLSDPNPTAEWERLRPMIDDVIHELDERDREAVLLRFFENRPFADIGATLRLSEDAARMRVDRALEKLRATLARRGVNSTSAALAVVFANQVAAHAPAGLAASIAGSALACAPLSGAPLIGATIFMSKTSTMVASMVAVAAIGAAFLQWTHAQRADAELAVIAADRDSLRTDLTAEREHARRLAQNGTALQREIDALKAPKAVAAPMPRKEPMALFATPTPEEVRASRSKAMLNNLRQVSAALGAFQAKYGRPPISLDEVVGEGKFIRALVPVNGEDYSKLSLASGQILSVTDTDGVTLTYDPSAPRPEPTPAELQAREMMNKLKPIIGRAVEAYRAANNNANPPGPDALLPYFATPQEGADFVEAVEAQKAAMRAR